MPTIVACPSHSSFDGLEAQPYESRFPFAAEFDPPAPHPTPGWTIAKYPCRTGCRWESEPDIAELALADAITADGGLDR